MQVITNATLDQFQNALGLNRRASWIAAQDGQRVYQIDSSLSPTMEIVTTVAQAFHQYKGKLPCSGVAYLAMKARFYAEHCKIRLCHYHGDTNPVRAVGGYIVLDDELMAFHNGIRGAGLWMLDHAINDGATKLTCFDVPHLIKLYQSRGFVETDRQWSTTRGKPDVVCMVKK